MLGYPPSPEQTPLGADTPQEQTLPQRSRPPGSRNPPGSRPLREQTPPGTDTPLGADTPPSWQTATAADGMHPTGMHSCLSYVQFSSISERFQIPNLKRILLSYLFAVDLTLRAVHTVRLWLWIFITKMGCVGFNVSVHMLQLRK